MTLGPLPDNEGAELGCLTVWTSFRGVSGPKKPTAGGAKGGPRQYVQLGGEEKVAAHRLAWLVDNPRGDFSLFFDTSVEASHLCSSSRCCVGTHIEFEPRPYNQSRSYCLFVWEDRSVDPPRLIDVCTHFPKCLQRGAVYAGIVAPWTTAQLARARGDLSQSELNQVLISSQSTEEQGTHQEAEDSLSVRPTLPEASAAPEPVKVHIEGVDDSSHYDGSSVLGGISDWDGEDETLLGS